MAKLRGSQDAIEREIARDGQVFYLFNNVAQIEEKAAFINELVPEARVAIAHGQMTVAQLENVMMDFVLGEFDVLVTTTIIETGVDIPNANTLLVEGADRMGLSTLTNYGAGLDGQLNCLCLFHVPAGQDVVWYLKNAMATCFTELGSGLRLPCVTCPFVGQVTCLKQQHGFVNSVGFDLYSQILRNSPT